MNSSKNYWEHEANIEEPSLGNHGKVSTAPPTSSSTSTNTDKEKYSHGSHGKDSKKNSKRKREEEKKSIDKKKKKKLTKNEECASHEYADVSQGGKPRPPVEQFRPLSCEVNLSPMELSLTEACMKYEMLRENYQNLRHSYLHLKRRTEEFEMQMSFNRRKSPEAPVKQIQELEGGVDPSLTSPTIREMEVDDDGSKWQISFLESDGKTWKVRWVRL